jgi:hypothetical protein
MRRGRTFWYVRVGFGEGESEIYVEGNTQWYPIIRSSKISSIGIVISQRKN